MYRTTPTSSKPKSKLSRAIEPIMLLEVTPSILESLGIGEGSIVNDGSVSYTPAKGVHRVARTLRVVKLKKHATRASATPADAAEPEFAGNVAETLSAEAMAAQMKCSRANVYDQEKRGHIFSVVPPGRTNGRLFPAFQLDAALDRELLRSLIAAYAERAVPLNLLWDFLRTANDAFGGLSGLQVLTRKLPKTSDGPSQVDIVTNMSDAQRREFVMDVALEDLTHAFI